MKRILVPVDFSKESLYALDFAYQLAKVKEAEIDLFHVVESHLHVYADIDGVRIVQTDEEKAYELFMTKIAQQKLQALAAQYSDVNLEVYLQIGNFMQSIAEKIADKPVDSIIMGSHGISNHDYEYVGSNTEKVVRYAKVPVLVIKDKVAPENINEIALFNSLYEEDMSDALIQHLARLQEILDARLHVVRVNVPGDVMPYREAKRRAEDWLDKHGVKNYTIAEYADVDEEEGVLHYAEDFGVDMIAIGTHGRRGLRRLLSPRPSIAEEVVTHAKLPVWTFNVEKGK